ncbi:MAG: alpha-L-rhamnosidase C-terminal domain-containing protein [Terriglobia bacterium]
MPHGSDTRRSYAGLAVILLALQAHILSFAEGRNEPGFLDPTLDISTPTLESTLHAPLPEQYIWGSQPGDPSGSTFLYFRKSFALRKVPPVATLYSAGANLIRVYVNGRLLASGDHDAKERIRPYVLGIDVSGQLRVGRNVVAVTASQGDRLVLKIVPAALQIAKPALLVTDATWKCDFHFHNGWERPGFDDRTWPGAISLGSIEEQSSFFQGNEDAGMYRWPGYDGVSPFLAHAFLKATDLTYGFEGMGEFHNISALLESATSLSLHRLPTPAGKSAVQGADNKPSISHEATVLLPARKVPPSEDPYLVLDFRKECPGRIRVISDSPAPMRLEVQYGESVEEALSNPYLGANEIYVPPYGTAYGPKSAFEYALVRFLGGVSPLRFKAIDVDYIYFPVKQLGSFESSDPEVNKIWQVGAYTAHLCMQDAIWDGPKRDRICLAGGLDVSGRVIGRVFDDRFLIGKSLKGLIDDAGKPVSKDVNGIPGFSALWVMSEADYFRHAGDVAHLESVHESLRGLMEYMASRIDDKGVLTNPNNRSMFVDWSPDLDSDSPEARRVTLMEFLRAFSDGAWLLEQARDSAASERFQQVAEKLRGDLLENSLDPTRNIFGERWQTNAMAIDAGLADMNQRAAIWENILSRPYRFTVTPHLNFYAISAMAEAGRRKEALEWIRDYWGRMLRPDTTTFWEGFDTRWPEEHFHAHLQTDHGEGYFVSLCHGWSSGPTAWLMEHVLGIQPVAAGFAKATIRPDLCGLQWARGTEPCPQGLVKVDYRHDDSDFTARIEIPEGVSAEVSMPVNRGEGSVQVDGRAVSGAPAEEGTRLTVPLRTPGLHELHSNLSLP